MAITEQDLIIAMAATGRPVSARTLEEWRQTGLLPDLASRSRGLRKGRICFWPDDTTFDRAALIYDLLQDKFAKREIYRLLWLCGVSVPLTQLRRAWTQKAKEAEAWKISDAVNQAATDEVPGSVTKALGLDTDTSQHISSHLLLQSALAACASLSPTNAPEIDSLIAAFDGLFGKSIDSGLGNAIDAETAKTIVALLKSFWSVINSSDLIYVSTDAHLGEAQQFTAMALRVLQRTTEPNVDIYRSRINTPAWPIAQARAFGAPLFIFALLMVRSGQRTLLDMALAQVKSNLARGVDLGGQGTADPQATPVSRPLELR